MSKAPSESSLRRLHAFGQSPWLDFIDRDLIRSGELKRLVEQGGIRGVTSNPAFFERAINPSDSYDDAIHAAPASHDAEMIYEALALADVGAAADVLRSVHTESAGRDGFVSLEVSPHLANQTDATVDAARRLWSVLDRPNVMIKVPATRAGLPAIRQLIGEAIPINVTLLFGLDQYRAVVSAYLEGLHDRAVRDASVDVASVASVFVSRIDTLFDRMLAEVAELGSSEAKTARQLQGHVAIACARRAYAIFHAFFEAPGCAFASLRAQGARPQRLLWASTSSKNPTYRDTKYVDALIGADTVTTLPVATMRAYADHGEPVPFLLEQVRDGEEVLDALREMGFDLADAAERLLEAGVRKFVEPYDALLASIERKRQDAVAGDGA